MCLNDWTNFRSQFPTLKEGKKSSYQYMSTNTFRGAAPTFSQSQSFKLLQPEILKPPPLMYSAPIENEETLNAVFFMPVKQIVTAPGPSKVWYSGVHEFTYSGGEHFEHPLLIVT